MSISIMLYISVFCKHIETHLNIGYNLVLSAKKSCKSLTCSSFFSRCAGFERVEFVIAHSACIAQQSKNPVSTPKQKINNLSVPSG